MLVSLQTLSPINTKVVLLSNVWKDKTIDTALKMKILHTVQFPIWNYVLNNKEI